MLEHSHIDYTYRYNPFFSPMNSQYLLDINLGMFNNESIYLKINQSNAHDIKLSLSEIANSNTYDLIAPILPSFFIEPVNSPHDLLDIGSKLSHYLYKWGVPFKIYKEIINLNCFKKIGLNPNHYLNVQKSISEQHGEYAPCFELEKLIKDFSNKKYQVSGGDKLIKDINVFCKQLRKLENNQAFVQFSKEIVSENTDEFIHSKDQYNPEIYVFLFKYGTDKQKNNIINTLLFSPLLFSNNLQTLPPKIVAFSYLFKKVLENGTTQEKVLLINIVINNIDFQKDGGINSHFSSYKKSNSLNILDELKYANLTNKERWILLSELESSIENISDLSLIEFEYLNSIFTNIVCSHNKNQIDYIINMIKKYKLNPSVDFINLLKEESSKMKIKYHL